MPSKPVRALALVLVLTCTYIAAAQKIPRPRIPQRVDNNRRSLVAGTVHRFARREFDRGQVEDSLPMNRVTIVLSPTAEQQAELETLLREQQDPGSPNYHQWLSPEEFA